MTRDGIIRLVVGGLALAGGIWLANATEWVEVQVPRPPRGAAAKDSYFAAELVLRQMGARVERRQALEPLPPPGARLLLTSQHWSLQPGRVAQLRRWVEAGGHLVIPAALVDREELAGWLPLEPAERPRPSRAEPRRSQNPPHCRQLAEPATLQAPGSDGQGFRFCTPAHWENLQPMAGVKPLWMLAGSSGVEMLRVPLGRGSVTAFGPYALLGNTTVLEADHALALATALQLERGTPVWLVTEEARPPLLAWLWTNGWIAVLLGVAALAAWLWRGAIRFGPVGAVPVLQRRSMREQLAGTGAFLQQHGTGALHAAQARALQETARACVPGFGNLAPAQAPQAIARLTRLDANALARALQPGPRPPEQLPAELELLEAARRRLLHPPQRKR